MATKKTTKKKATPGQTRPGSKPGTAQKRQQASPRPRPKMPGWLKSTLVGLVIFTLTLTTGPLPQVFVCALALGVAVWQLWGRRSRFLWTWACFAAVALYLVGFYLTTRYAPMWYLYFGAWIFVIVAFVGEGRRALRAWRESFGR